MLEFSPDGMYVVAGVGQGVAWEQRCGLFEVRTGREIAGFDATPGDEDHVYCSYANWTHDGSMVIVSQGGGN